MGLDVITAAIESRDSKAKPTEGFRQNYALDYIRQRASIRVDRASDIVAWDSERVARESKRMAMAYVTVRDAKYIFTQTRFEPTNISPIKVCKL